MLRIDVDTGRSNFVKYDENLFEVYVLNYDDNYHRDENAPTTEFEQEVRKIKARYRDITKYNGAIALYNEYMVYLQEKYGGPDLYKLKKKAGLINDYIPPKPRIKNTRELRYLKKNKIILGSMGRNFIDDEKLDDIIDFYSEDINIDKIIVNQSRDKTAEKISEEISPTKNISIKSQSFKDDYDFLDYYFKNKNVSSKKKKNKKNKKKNKKDKLLIKDFMRDDYADYIYGDDPSMEDSEQSMAVYNNILLSTATTKELDVYHKLNEIGWNSFKLMKKGEFSKRITDAFKPPKKKKKKNSKKSDKYDGLLIDIMTDNGFDTDDMDSFAEFQKEMLNMTSADVFK